MKTFLIVLGLLFSAPAFSIDVVTDANFAEVTSDLTGVVYYYGDWCPYCKKMEPVLKQLEKELPKVKFTKLDISANEIHGDFANTVPLIAFYKDGVYQGKVTGYTHPEAIKRFFHQWAATLE